MGNDRKGECEWAVGVSRGPGEADKQESEQDQWRGRSVRASWVGELGRGYGRRKGEEDNSNLKLIRIHIPRRTTTFLCYLIFIYFKSNFENFTDFTNRCRSRAPKMPNTRYNVSKYSRIILSIGTNEAPLPGLRREQLFFEVRHFSLLYFHMFPFFTQLLVGVREGMESGERV